MRKQTGEICLCLAPLKPGSEKEELAGLKGTVILLGVREVSPARGIEA